MTLDPRSAIEAKERGEAVDPDELRRLIDNYVAGELGDGPMAAFLMAIVIRGMAPTEVRSMTETFVDSGARLVLDGLGRPVVDKHSTGGVGDGVSLVFAPLVAALGLACVKLSGHGLGHTGGTIDKLGAIPGFRVDLTLDEMRRQAAAIGCVLASQTDDLVPADRAIYALRDATATVRSIPLIAASVMAKKLAVGSDLIVLDVKLGSGAFFDDPVEATDLARLCLAIAREQDRRAVAAVTDMSRPLGTAIGNALEVREAIEVLRGDRPGRLRQLAVELAARALTELLPEGTEAARARAEAALTDGSGLRAFAALVAAQGGDPRVVDKPQEVLPSAALKRPLVADRPGVLEAADAAALGEATRALGAGRVRPADPIDPGVGIVLRPTVGDRIEEGDEIGELHARDEQTAARAERAVLAALTIGEGPASPPPLVHRWLEEVS